MSDDGRLVSGGRRSDDRENIALRPKLLSELIGQDRVREQLKIIIEAAQGRKEPVDHILFYGPPGLGKTSLAYVIANEMNANIRITAGPSIERAGDLAAILTHLKQGDILFIDEIHRLGRAVEEVLYPAMEDFALDIVIGKGPAAKNVRLNLPRFTVIGATTQLALLAGPLRDRFGARFRLDYYEQAAMEQIIARAAGMLKIEIKPEGLIEIARRSRGTPRVGLRLLRRSRDYAQTRAQGIITGPVAGESLELMGIDYLGLDDIDRRVLQTIILNYEGGPVGLPTIAASISEDSSTIMDVYEPYLMQLGFLKRTPRGRVATARAYEHIGIPYPGGNGISHHYCSRLPLDDVQAVLSAVKSSGSIERTAKTDGFPSTRTNSADRRRRDPDHRRDFRAVRAQLQRLPRHDPHRGAGLLLHGPDPRLDHPQHRADRRSEHYR